MEPRGSVPHTQGLSNNPYPELNQSTLIPISSRSILILSSHLLLGLPKCPFPVGLPVKIWKYSYLPPFSTSQSLDLMTLTILGERYKLWSSSFGAFSTPPSYPSGPNIRLRIPFSFLEIINKFPTNTRFCFLKFNAFRREWGMDFYPGSKRHPIITTPWDN